MSADCAVTARGGGRAGDEVGYGGAMRVGGAGGEWRGPIGELGKFYEMLLNGGHPILKRETVELFTSRQRIGVVDQTFKHVVDWGLGFILNSERYGVGRCLMGMGRLRRGRHLGMGGVSRLLRFVIQ